MAGWSGPPRNRDGGLNRGSISVALSVPYFMSAALPFSVIVRSQSSGSRLQATLGSAWEQRWIQPQLIVVDRGSPDATRAWLHAQRARIAGVVLLAEQENIFEGLNRALAAAEGEWVLFLDAGDRLVGDMVLTEALNWMRKTEAGAVAGQASYDDGRIEKLRGRVHPISRNFLPRGSTFYRRSLFAENGVFDVRYAIMADYEFNARLWKNRVRFKPIALRVIAAADRRPFTWTACREQIRVRHAYFPAWQCWPWDLLSVLRRLGSATGRQNDERGKTR